MNLPKTTRPRVTGLKAFVARLERVKQAGLIVEYEVFYIKPDALYCGRVAFASGHVSLMVRGDVKSLIRDYVPQLAAAVAVHHKVLQQ